MKTYTCIGCEKTPEQITEYVFYAKEENMTPTQWMIKNEGTFNQFRPDQFFCTACYIRAGQPVYRSF